VSHFLVKSLTTSVQG